MEKGRLVTDQKLLMILKKIFDLTLDVRFKSSDKEEYEMIRKGLILELRNREKEIGFDFELNYENDLLKLKSLLKELKK